MKIIVDTHAGFCEGVRTAVEKVHSLLLVHKAVHIHGELIHNRDMVSLFSRRGLVSHTSYNDIPDNSTAVLRTHGTKLSDFHTLRKRSSKLVNLCCSNVTRIQGIIKKYSADGTHILITGDPGHPETESLSSYAKEYTVLSSMSGCDTIPDRKSYLLVSQTTFDIQKFSEIETYLKKKFSGRITVIPTICDAAYKRQKGIENSIHKATTLVVAGGKNSSNTKRLADTGRRLGIKTFHVEDEKGLDYADFSPDDVVLLTAGASTPDFIIDRTMKRLELFDIRQKSFARYIFSLCISYIVHGSLVISLPVMLLLFLQAVDPFCLLLTAVSLSCLHAYYNARRIYNTSSTTRLYIEPAAFISALLGYTVLYRKIPFNSYEILLTAAVLICTVVLFALSDSRFHRKYCNGLFSYEIVCISAVVVPLLTASLLYTVPPLSILSALLLTGSLAVAAHRSFPHDDLFGIDRLSSHFSKKSELFISIVLGAAAAVTAAVTFFI